MDTVFICALLVFVIATFVWLSLHTSALQKLRADIAKADDELRAMIVELKAKIAQKEGN